MNRQTRKGILHVVFRTARAEYGWGLADVEEVIARICDAEEAQEKRDAEANFSEAIAAMELVGIKPRSEPIDSREITTQDVDQAQQKRVVGLATDVGAIAEAIVAKSLTRRT